MKLLDLKQVHKGKFLSYYVASFLNKDGKVKEYEFISRDSTLTKEKFGNNVPAGVGLVALNETRDKVLLQAEFRTPNVNPRLFNCRDENEPRLLRL